MDIKQGDRVCIDGKIASVETWWGAGKHRIFKLSDGRTVTDLHNSVASGHVKIIEDEEPPQPKSKTWTF